MVSSNAFKLGDIIRYRNGKSVEIMNTDAEGRLVLADGLIDASAEKPQFIIDAATLTGAAKVAVGNDYHSVLSFDDQLVNELLDSSNEELELFWRLPLAEFHRQQLPSGFADLNNIASPSNTAGLVQLPHSYRILWKIIAITGCILIALQLIVNRQSVYGRKVQQVSV